MDNPDEIEAKNQPERSEFTLVLRDSKKLCEGDFPIGTVPQTCVDHLHFYVALTLDRQDARRLQPQLFVTPMSEAAILTTAKTARAAFPWMSSRKDLLPEKDEACVVIGFSNMKLEDLILLDQTQRDQQQDHLAARSKKALEILSKSWALGESLQESAVFSFLGKLVYDSAKRQEGWKYHRLKYWDTEYMDFTDLSRLDKLVEEEGIGRIGAIGQIDDEKKSRELFTDRSLVATVDEIKRLPDNEERETLVKSLFRAGARFRIYPPLPPVDEERLSFFLCIYKSVPLDMKHVLLKAALRGPEYPWLVKHLDRFEETADLVSRDYRHPLFTSTACAMRILVDEEHRIATTVPIPNVSLNAPFWFKIGSGLSKVAVRCSSYRTLFNTIPPASIVLDRLKTIVFGFPHEFKGRTILDCLDLRRSVITGSSLMQAINIDSPSSAYAAYYTEPSNLLTYRRMASNGKGRLRLTNGVTPETLVLKSDEDELILTFKPGSDIDIAVIEGDFETIAWQHIRVFQRFYPDAIVRKVEKKKRGLAPCFYEITDPHFVFRPIQIYSATMSSIMTHHIAPVRGLVWDDGKGLDVYLTASAIVAYTSQAISEYYYFAGKKSPLKVIVNAIFRGFYVSNRAIDPVADWAMSEAAPLERWTTLASPVLEGSKYGFSILDYNQEVERRRDNRFIQDWVPGSLDCVEILDARERVRQSRLLAMQSLDGGSERQ